MWNKVRSNRRFLGNIFKTFGRSGSVTNTQAYRLYGAKHAKKAMDGWAQMNVRNTLSAAAYKGQGLMRSRPGKYLLGGAAARFGNAVRKFRGNQYVKIPAAGIRRGGILKNLAAGKRAQRGRVALMAIGNRIRAFSIRSLPF